MVRITRKTLLFLSFLLSMTIFFSCQSTATKSPDDKKIEINVAQLVGKWQAVDNPKTVIELTNTRMYSFYNGLKLSDESLMIYHNCVAWCIPKDRAQMPCIITDGKRAENCFEIIELTDKKLTYALMGKVPKIFNFQKM